MNLVVCIDGTCNSIGGDGLDSRSVVSRLVDFLETSHQQCVAYDHGIGTSPDVDAPIQQRDRHTAESAGTKDAQAMQPFRVLRPPARGIVNRLRGVLFGHGLRENVLEVVKWLAESYQGPQDRIFLFGFSRGAFTARAVAGLLERCGLPTADRASDPEHLAECWSLFDPLATCPVTGLRRRMLRARQAGLDFGHTVAEFRARTGQRRVGIHFIGLWDTVKSYGTIWPVMLPLLRHNPAVHAVRHALALDERKGWFDATTWGGLDSDRREGGPFSRLGEDVVTLLARQSVAEVWFQGGHSSVGSGEAMGDAPNPNPALTWMLAEAALHGLKLNPSGMKRLESHRDQGEPPPGVFRPDRWLMRATDFFPRATIDNGGEWPKRSRLWFRGAAPRDPTKSARSKVVWVHQSVNRLDSPSTSVEIRRVRTESARALACVQGMPSASAQEFCQPGQVAAGE